MKKLWAVVLGIVVFVSCASTENVDKTELKPHEKAFFTAWRFKDAVNRYFRNQLTSDAVAELITFAKAEEKAKFVVYLAELKRHDPVAKILKDAMPYPIFNNAEFEVVKQQENKYWVKRKKYVPSDVLLIEVSENGECAVSDDNDFSKIQYMGIPTKQDVSGAEYMELDKDRFNVQDLYFPEDFKK